MKARILQAIVDALADEDVDLIVSVGRDGRPDELTPAANARIERFVSHPDLLPHCDLLITHGGHGTAMAAASAGGSKSGRGWFRTSDLSRVKRLRTRALPAVVYGFSKPSASRSARPLRPRGCGWLRADEVGFGHQKRSGAR